jgi:peptidoglycan hydrolase CwlO-like protein
VRPGDGLPLGLPLGALEALKASVTKLQNGQKTLGETIRRFEESTKEQIRATDCQIGAVQDLFENHVRHQLADEGFLAPIVNPIIDCLVSARVKNEDAARSASCSSATLAGDAQPNGHRGESTAAAGSANDLFEKMAAMERSQAELAERVSHLSETLDKLVEKQNNLEPSLQTISQSLMRVFSDSSNKSIP